MRSSKVAGTAECYTAAVHACRQKGYLKFALSIYEDMQKDGVLPDEVHILWSMRFMLQISIENRMFQSRIVCILVCCISEHLMGLSSHHQN